MAAARGHPHPRREEVGARARRRGAAAPCRSSIAARSPRCRWRARPRSTSSWSPISRGCARAPISSSTACAPRPGSRLGAFFARDWPRGGAQPVARDPGRAAADPGRRARRLSARGQRPELVRQLRPARAGQRPRFQRHRPNILRETLYDSEGASGAQRLRHLSVHPQQPGLDAVLRARLRLRRADRDAARSTTARCSARSSPSSRSHGLGPELGGWLIIHGTTEILRDHPRRRGGLQDRLERGLPRRARPGSPPRPAPAATAALVMAGVVRDAARRRPARRLRPPADHQRRRPLRDRPAMLLALAALYFYLPRRGAPMADLAARATARPSRQAAQPGHARGRRPQPAPRRRRPARRRLPDRPADHGRHADRAEHLLLGVVIAAFGLRGVEIARDRLAARLLPAPELLFHPDGDGAARRDLRQARRRPARRRAQRRAADRRPGDRPQHDARDRILPAALLPVLQCSPRARRTA